VAKGIDSFCAYTIGDIVGICHSAIKHPVEIKVQTEALVPDDVSESGDETGIRRSDQSRIGIINNSVWFAGTLESSVFIHDRIAVLVAHIAVDVLDLDHTRFQLWLRRYLITNLHDSISYSRIHRTYRVVFAFV